MTTSTWQFQGFPIHCLRQGTSPADRPAVLLVHGFGASTDHWRFNIPALQQHYEVHALDLLGFGRSAKPAGPSYGGALWRDQLVSYVRGRIGRPTVIVGNSLGGYAALAAGAAANGVGTITAIEKLILMPLEESLGVFLITNQ